MNVCPTMSLSVGAVPATILPDLFFPPKLQHEASTHNFSSGWSASMPFKAKQTAAAEPFDSIPAAHGPTTHQIATLYGTFKHQQACNNQAGMPACQRDLPAPSHPVVPAVSTFSRQQQQLAILHDLHKRHLQQQQHATAHHEGHSTLAPAATTNTAVSSKQQQHGYTAHGSFTGGGSNSSGNAVAANVTAGTAAGIDDMLVLCDEAVEEVDNTDWSSSCSVLTSHSSMEIESTDNADDRKQQRDQSHLITAASKSATSILQALGNVATRRKGYAALNPARASSSSKLVDTAVAAAQEGSESVRARSLITEVSVYCGDIENHHRSWASSPLALVQANKLMGSMALPEHTTYMPITSESWIFQTASGYQFPSFVICLGSSYMQRMLAILPQLAEAAAAVPEFECYCSYLPAEARPAPRTEQLTGHELAATEATLRSVQFTCLFIALKVADRVHALGLLRYILTKISHNQHLVTTEEAAGVEAQCLHALGWRLGPWFAETELTGNDEELWAAAMGSSEYGSDADCWA